MQLEKYKKIIFHPLTWALLIFLAVHVFNITRFDFLAEKDSYGWLLKYEDNLKYNSVNDYRQLFSSLLISIYYLTGLSLFDVFKYLMPLLFSVVLIPLWLLARNLKNKFAQVLILLAPLGSATLILQMDATRPQIMAMLFLYFSLGLATIAKKDENRNFVAALLGVLVLIGSLFHRVFVIFLLLLAISCAYNYRKLIWQSKGKMFLLLFLAIPWIEKIEAKAMLLKAVKSMKEIVVNILVNPQFNFQFPMFYVNVDNKQMGWENLFGVAKYYAFYAGPFFLAIVGSVILLLVFSEKFRGYFKEKVENRSFLFVFLLIGFFIAIAEIFPRIGNIAYLPDRAWVFLGILLILPLYLVLDFAEKNFQKKQLQNLVLVLFLFLLVSSSGGLYVNNAMKNIIPGYKMQSYEWIRKNLKSGSLIFSSDYNGALKYHSNLDVLAIKKDIFKNNDLNQLVAILKLGNKNKFDRNLFRKILGKASFNLEELKTILKGENFSYTELRAKIKELRIEADNLFVQINSAAMLDKGNAVYVYVADNLEKNPYSSRDYSTGYYAGIDNSEMEMLEKNPQYFEKVYDMGDVVIWKFSY